MSRTVRRFLVLGCGHYFYSKEQGAFVSPRLGAALQGPRLTVVAGVQDLFADAALSGSEWSPLKV